MRRGLIAALLVLIGGILTPQIASAGVFVGQTNLNIHVQEDRVTGMLVGRPECRGDQRIDLYVGGVWTDWTTTDGLGNYGFDLTSVPPTTVQTRFAGSQTGVHPDRFTCTPSVSRIVDVWKVKTANGPAKTTPTSRAAVSLARHVEAVGRAFSKALSG